MKKGDIVLIPFPFTDLSGNKTRPALILNENAQDIIVAFITSQLKWKEISDVSINPSDENGLKKISLVRLGKLATLDKDLVIGRLGSLNRREIQSIDQNIIQLFQLRI